MPIWDVNITSTSIRNVRVEADSEEEALKKARSVPEEERGPESVYWDYEAYLADGDNGDD